MLFSDLVFEVINSHLEKARIQSEAYVYASCPFHKDTKPSFYASRENGSWGCWSCGTHGSNLESLLKEIGVDNYSLKKEIKFHKEKNKKQYVEIQLKKEIKKKKDFVGTSILPEEVLGVYDWTPIHLAEIFGDELIERHQIGYDQTHERIIFPIRDIYGNLIGISGRKRDQDFGPKYKIYQGHHVTKDGLRSCGELGEWYPFYSSDGIKDHLWRGEQVFWKIYSGEMQDLIVVEGFKAALWLVRCGYENVVALMQARMTPRQELLIRRLGTPTWFFLRQQPSRTDRCTRCLLEACKCSISCI